MRIFWKAFVIILILGIGAWVYLYGRSLPVYITLEDGSFEDPVGRMTKLGVGIISVGAGLALALWLAWKYARCPLERKWRFVMRVGAWLWGIWLLVMFPWLCMPHYFSSDFFAIIAPGSLAALVGLLLGYSLPERIRWRRPIGVWGHVRFVLLALWLISLLALVGLVVADGHAETIIISLGAVPLLLAVLFAVPKAGEAAGTEGVKSPVAETEPLNS
jgi:hypothetical protein